MEAQLTVDERSYLLELARQAMVCAVSGKPPPVIATERVSAALLAEGASFVTLTQQGRLRGCIGALEAYQSLVEDVREHAGAAAVEDYRFAPVRPDEVGQIAIEISRLTPAVALEYVDATDLLSKIRPGVDGVILRDGGRRATFLPQVWEKIPDGESFLGNLCAKMGASPEAWRKKHLEVLVYQVEDFHE